MTNEKVILIVMTAFALKHFFADFPPLQNSYMIMGKGRSSDWVKPLAAHCLVHALFTALIFLVYSPQHMYLALIDFLFHFFIDRMKATYKLDSGTWAPEQRAQNLSKYYFAFGLDQLAHGLTYILLVFLSMN